MSRLCFQGLSFVDRTYPFLWVYLGKGTESYSDIVHNQEPFMEIGISEEKELFFTYFDYNKKDITLSLEEWKEIQRMAEDYAPRVLANEECFQRWSIVNRKEFEALAISTTEELDEFIEKIIADPTNLRYGDRRRLVYLQEATQIIVIKNPETGENTAFKPGNWERYLTEIPNQAVLPNASYSTPNVSSSQEAIRMQLTEIDEQHVELTLGKQDLFIIKACLRENFSSYDEKSFEERFGTSESNFMKLSNELRVLMDRENLPYF
jgi:hypothetical protein